ncbi:MAG: polysaccharide pyruvyl transferase family protein [Candidatus Anammoxibacter sp.]
MTEDTQLSVIIASYQDVHNLGRCLKSLAKQTAQCQFEVIVVDSSDDVRTDKLCTEYPWVQFYLFKYRKYPGEARNIGISNAKGEIFAFTDADCEVPEDWVSKIIQAHKENERPVIGGVTDNGNPETLRSWAYYFCSFSQWMPGTPEGEVVEIPTTCLSVKRWAFERFGPFWGGGYCSDTIFNWQSSEAGYAPYFLPSLKVYHFNIDRARDFLKRKFRHGKFFGQVRAYYQKFSPIKKVVYLLLTPLLVWVLYYRLVIRVYRCKIYRKEFVLSSPLIIAGLFCWSLGEVLGYFQAIAHEGSFKEESKKKQILLFRNLFKSIGDEAMLEADIERIKSLFPEDQLTVFTDNPIEISKKYNVATEFSEISLSHPFHRKNIYRLRSILSSKGRICQGISISSYVVAIVSRIFLAVSCRLFVWNAKRLSMQKSVVFQFSLQKRLLQFLSNADLLIAGGGLLPSLPLVFIPRKTIYRAASILNIPVILHGQSMPDNQQLAVPLRDVTQIVLRDHELSYKTAMKLGVSKERLHLGVDPAFFLKPAPEEDVDAVFKEIRFDFTKESFIAVNVRGWKTKDFRPFFEKLAEALKAFQKQSSLPILLFGMQSYWNRDDHVELEMLKECLHDIKPIKILRRGLKPSVMKGILGRAYCVVTSRYHGAVFGLCQGVPAITLSVSREHDVKLLGIMKMFENEDYFFRLEELDSGKILDRLNSFSRNYETVRMKLLDRMNSLKHYNAIPDQLFQKAILREDVFDQKTEIVM